MLAKLSTLAVLLPLVASITVTTPTSAWSGGPMTITWTASTADPTYFSIELVNSVFNNDYAIAANVPTSQGSLTLTIPQVPAIEGYTLQFVATNNINQIYTQTSPFAIKAPSNSTTSAAPTTSGTTASSSPSGTFSKTATKHVSGASGTASHTGTSSPSAGVFNSSGASSLNMPPGLAHAVALVLSAVAGAAMVF